MKNLFTFIVALFMATSVYAQGTYAVSNGVVPEGGSKITSVPNITMTWGEDNWKDNKKVNGKFDGMDYKVTGSSNAAVSNMVPSSGAYVAFEATKDGVVTFCYKLNKNKTQHFVDQDGNKVVESIHETSGTSVYLKTDIPVKAGVKYYTYTEGSRMDVFGFKYLVNEKVTITEAGFATFAASYPVDYSANGLEAYAVKYANGTLIYNKIDGIVPANTAVLLSGEAKEYTLAAAGGAATTVDTDLNVADGTKKGATNIYCLANKNNVVGFYQVSSDVTIPANKAYLEIATSSSTPAKYYSIGIGGNTTGIQAIHQNSVKADGIMYSLSGQRVGKDYKGIVICNGKKMIKK